MILKMFHFLGAVFRFFWCKCLLVFGRYDKKYCAAKYFDKGFRAEGWYWMYHAWRGCLISGANSSVPWPVCAESKVVGWQNIIFDSEDLHNFQSKGCYFQGVATITIGKGTFIANNVGIITANHDVMDVRKHAAAQPVTIGEKCWIGMNCTILPGVELGPNVVVGAGTVVTHSFREGYCVIAGNPAKIIKTISHKNGEDASC